MENQFVGFKRKAADFFNITNDYDEDINNDIPNINKNENNSISLLDQMKSRVKTSVNSIKPSNLGSNYNNLSIGSNNIELIYSNDIKEVIDDENITTLNNFYNNTDSNYNNDIQNIDTSIITNNTAKSADKPLYKTLKAGDSIFAKYKDGNFYEATIKSVVHKGFPSAKYDIKYNNYEDIETVSWSDIKLSNVEHSRDILIEDLRSNDINDFGRDRTILSNSSIQSQLKDQNIVMKNLNRLKYSLLNRRTFPTFDDNIKYINTDTVDELRDKYMSLI